MSNLAEEKLEFLQKNRNIYLASEKRPKEREENIFLYYNSGVFPIFLTLLLLLSFVILLNIGLRMQLVSYNRQIFEYERIISLEEERTDRLNLQIAELRSPNRVIAHVDGKKAISNASFTKINVTSGITGIHEEIKNHSAKDDELEIRKYKSFANAIGNIRDIIMVVSESVLTFFIP